ncbi:Lycopene beta cyclase, chloroplastic [Auxenochlorella protothecoides]|nr:Lycopene beta cyclase, chloroplastic [Auxenochlorella protothecoides]KFM24907.1 Lycopene beta cyclase, chloroplastic [Auxenochlorella protothecoides]RMZ52602.1 hypothetical protein APUTEX25_000721 [Auxenochlorella protothecoides]|eukprot:RMZ52602.1 hypothetical protein APUTEX25_000721 [Auxenochlorella protothecoides]
MRPPHRGRPVQTQAVATTGPPAAKKASISSPNSQFPDLQLDAYDPMEVQAADLVVVGAGPAGLSVAARVSQAGFRVVLVDPDPLGEWRNNYGVWCDEFEDMGLEDCFDTVWDRAVVYLDSGPDGQRSLSRPYARVDRPRLKRKMLSECVRHGVQFHSVKAEDATHGDGRSTLRCSDGSQVTASLVLDASGHSRSLVKYDTNFDPGYQGAYGFVAEVEWHPFDPGAMLFMDWRDDHLADRPDLRASNERLPSFLYAMPLSATSVFLEETSLVARPIIPFEDLKVRLEARLKYLGLEIKSISEEEYCRIPMGGALPTLPQRVLGLGGTAGMVHPSTGYMISRVLGAAPLVADTIIDQLCSVSDRAQDRNTPRAPRSEEEADAMAAAVWAALWPKRRQRQREFFWFGMEILLKLDLHETRNFFSAFFSLSEHHWHGFLSARLTFTELIGFGLSLFAKSSSSARLGLIAKGLPGLVTMLARLTQIK